LQTLISQGGYQPILFPSLEVEPLNNIPLQTYYDAVIFISINAVEYGLEVLKNLEYQDSNFFSVGAATANKLNEYDFEVDAFPNEKASSEALLAIPEVKALVDKDILIFRGKGGREILREGLEQHNTVEYIEVYQRIVCNITSLHYASLSKFLQSDKGIIIATSVENLTAFLSIVERIDADVLNTIKHYPLAVLSKRIRTFAQSKGFTQVEVTKTISDEGLLEALTNLTKS
jgi:uroporphyrinogen-III synthase